MARSPSTGRKGRRIETAVRRVAAGKRLVLAVSGGRDSMALLHAAARVARRSVAAVATFDHGTGPVATRATEIVASEAARLGLPVVIGRTRTLGTSEAEWRSARLEFLADVARRLGEGTVVATAHTRDDQVETVLMRVLRDAGARGLAGLYAAGDTLRPLLELSRDEVAAYAKEVGALWIEDPTNLSMQFVRNRIRHDLLPALERVNPTIAQRLIALSRAAAEWRDEIDARAAALSRVGADGTAVFVAALQLAPYSRAELSVIWPAFAARVGLAMDWRGTERAAAFTTTSRPGSRVQLAGGWEVARTRNEFVLRRATPPSAERQKRQLAPGMQWDRWRFDSTPDAGASSDHWVAQLPIDTTLTVRRWQPGDRMRLDGGFRKVKRFLSDAHVSGTRRGEWPVVLAGDEIVWIPGVRRSDAAAVRPGRPGVLYRCELDDR